MPFRSFVTFFVFCSALHASVTADAGVIYAVSGGSNSNPADSILYQVDTANGLANRIGGIRTADGTAISHISGLAFDPVDGAFYGHQNFPGLFDPVGVLHRIDPKTGIVLSSVDTRSAITDLAFHRSGQLFGWMDLSSLPGFETSADELVTINKATGAIERRLQVPVNRSGLTITPDGRLFLTSGDIDGRDVNGHLQGTLHKIAVNTNDFSSSLIDSVSSNLESRPNLIPISTLQAISNNLALSVRVETADDGRARRSLVQTNLSTGIYRTTFQIREFDAATNEFTYPVITAIAAPVAVPEPSTVAFMTVMTLGLLGRRLLLGRAI